MKVRELCLICRHQSILEGGCRAFPEDIPYKYSSGKEKHLTVDKDQIGNYVFEEGEPDELKSILKSK